jgi:hypothetical protein
MQKEFNLTYDLWDNITNTPIPNGKNYYTEDSAISDGFSILQHLEIVTNRKDFIVRKFKLEEVYLNPHKKFYHIINHHVPVSFITDLMEENDGNFIYKPKENELISNQVKKCLKECDNVKIILLTEHEPINEDEFIGIIKYFELNGIKTNKVVLINNNSNLYEYKIKYNSDVLVHKINYLLYCKIRDYNNYGGCEYNPNKEGKFFLTFNKSHRAHRLALLCILKKTNLLNDTNWSFIPTDHNVVSKEYFDKIMDNHESVNLENEINYFNNLKFKLSDYENENYNFSIDNQQEMIDIAHVLTTIENVKTYEHSYVNITTESLFENLKNTIHISEKSYKPFYYLQIPIFLASPYHLKKIREEFNLDLFDDIIDHSYDLERDHKKRFNMVINEIKRVYQNKDNIIEFYRNNRERLEENKKKTINLMNFVNKDYDFFKSLI